MEKHVQNDSGLETQLTLDKSLAKLFKYRFFPQNLYYLYEHSNIFNKFGRMTKNCTLTSTEYRNRQGTYEQLHFE